MRCQQQWREEEVIWSCLFTVNAGWSTLNGVISIMTWYEEEWILLPLHVFLFFFTSVCPSFSEEVGLLPLRCFWSGCSLVCSQDPTYPLERRPEDEHRVRNGFLKRPNERYSFIILKVWHLHLSISKLLSLITCWSGKVNRWAFTLMLERRSFFRTSLLMSLTATDSSCW